MMDKHGQEITVKINGKERPFTTDKPIETNILENEKEAEPRPSASFQQKKRKKRSPIIGALNARIKSAIFSIMMAVIIGTSFGFIVLNVIPKEKEHSGQTLETELPVPAESKDSTGQAAESANEAAASSFTVSVIQAGVFTDREAAAAYARQLQSSAIPVVAVGEKPVALFIAVGSDKQQLQAINERYKQKTHSTYIKFLSFASTDRERKPVIKAGEALYREMAAISAILLGKGDVHKEEWKKLESDYKQFISQTIPNDDNIKRYVSHMKAAYNLLIAYKTNQQEELLQKTQQELLEALKSYISVFPLRS
ncbi:stage II sporulation protein B [Parageobacillus thermoglucosidasius]|uniref:Stage II sporulation protein B n=1 Tax=Parageobacillus thermoglucosidasius TaxID=1426 RepID=A0AB38QVX1_PARTM|nr:stage II sporulation protein B [Parageobacillus thermoglucosidasius]UOE75543.1 stage II sporulation protein B [Parageobacillus thermoglucosidasius]